ncbi:MAG: pyridoxamine 5'-phosphate oxidase family protein, partial [Promethearchaeota archaeon]
MNEKTPLNFKQVVERLRKKTFGILTTISKDGHPHSTGILYGVSPPGSKFSIYVLTRKSYRKVKNIESNPKVSFVIPFPHYILRF